MSNKIRLFAPILGVALAVAAPAAHAVETTGTTPANPEGYASSWGDRGVEFSTPQSDYCRISEDRGPDGLQFLACRYGDSPESIVSVVTGQQATSVENPGLPFTTLDRSEPARLNVGQELTVGAGHCVVTEEEGTICGIGDNSFTLPAEN